MPDLFIPPWLPPSPRLLIIGQSPGIEEYRQERPFIGPAGQEARAWLHEVGADPDEDCAWDNIVQDFHPEEHAYKPKVAEIQAARYRIAETDYGDVEVAILLGEYSMRMAQMATTLGVGKLMGMSSPLIVGHGDRPGNFTKNLKTVPAFACYHPSFILRVRNAAVYAEHHRLRAQCLCVIEQAWLLACGESPRNLPMGKGVYAKA